MGATAMISFSTWVGDKKTSVSYYSHQQLILNQTAKNALQHTNIPQQYVGISGGCSSCGLKACSLKICVTQNCNGGEEAQLLFEMVFKRKKWHSTSRKQMSVKSKLLPSMKGQRQENRFLRVCFFIFPFYYILTFVIIYGREAFCFLLENFFRVQLTWTVCHVF